MLRYISEVLHTIGEPTRLLANGICKTSDIYLNKHWQKKNYLSLHQIHNSMIFKNKVSVPTKK
jgi:hypothetical protein